MQKVSDTDPEQARLKRENKSKGKNRENDEEYGSIIDDGSTMMHSMAEKEGSDNEDEKVDEEDDYNDDTLHNTEEFSYSFSKKANTPLKFGSLTPLCQKRSKGVLVKDRYKAYIGPDWWYTLVLFLFVNISFGVYMYSYLSLENLIMNSIVALVYFAQELSMYLMLISDPGLAAREIVEFENPMDERTASKYYCETWDIIRWEGVDHWSDCGVCIIELDHHCPWSSKWIGRDNLVIFYFFVSTTVIYILWMIGVISVLNHSNN